MIVYESNKNWLRDVSHLYKSWTMQRVIRSTLYVAAVTAVISLFYKEVLEWKGGNLDITIFSLLGVVLSILLSFRTNSAYDRWWEGRKKWGELVNNSRNLAVYLHSCLPQDDDESRHYLAVRISNFAIALKEHLRSGAQTDEFIMVSAEEIKQYNRKAHIPNFIAYEIIQHIQDAYRAGHLSTADHINIKQHSRNY
jgi:putative membrane protein